MVVVTTDNIGAVICVNVVGVWTLEEKGESPHIDVTFDTATPTASHMSLVALEHAGMLVTL